MCIRDRLQRYLAHGDVYLHLREGTAEGIGVRADGGGALRLSLIHILTGKNGVRRLPIHDFYIKAGKVDIRAEDGEIQTAVLIPKESYENCFGHYIKYAMRNAMDIATLGTSVNVRLSADKKTVERARAVSYTHLTIRTIPRREPSGALA